MRNQVKYDSILMVQEAKIGKGVQKPQIFSGTYSQNRGKPHFR